MSDDLRIVDVPSAGRFEAWLEDDLVGIVEYRTGTGWLALLHTEVLPEHEGRGIGTRLAAGALATAKDRGGRVIVRCPFISAWLLRHPEAAEGIAPADRGVPEAADPPDDAPAAQARPR